MWFLVILAADLVAGWIHGRRKREKVAQPLKVGSLLRVMKRKKKKAGSGK